MVAWRDGGTFLVRDGRQRPQFYIRRRLRSARVRWVRPIRSLSQTLLLRCAGSTDRDARAGGCPGLRDRLHEVGIDTFEADVRFAMRYLIERGIKGGCEIEGHPDSRRQRDLGVRRPCGTTRGR